MDAAAIAAVVVILISAGASFFFALAETALFSLSKWQMRQLSERAPRFGRVISQLLADPQDLLATMVLGNTFATAAMLAARKVRVASAAIGRYKANVFRMIAAERRTYCNWLRISREGRTGALVRTGTNAMRCPSAPAWISVSSV